MSSIAGKVLSYLVDGSSQAVRTVDIPSVEIHNVETAPEKRPRTLKHLLKANHINFSIFYNRLRFHNHMPHVLSSAYLLGANENQLQHIYDEEAKELEPWHDAPGEINDHDWQDFLGKKEYQRAYIDFFEDELALKFSYNWKKVAEEYLFSGENPLINSMAAGLGHSLIHLGYAYEVSSREIGIEALAMAAGAYNEIHKYLDDEKYTFPVPNTSTSPFDLLKRLAEDDRLKEVYRRPEEDTWQTLPDEFEQLLLEYWNSWEILDPKKQFQESQESAVALLVSTVHGDRKHYDFFLVHLLTTSHAVRILLPLIPGNFHMSLVRQWWLLTIITYISQRRPTIDNGLIEKVNLKGKDWKYAADKAINGPHGADSHFLKGLRAMREAALTWGDPNDWYLKAAVKFVDEFDGWGFD